MSHFAVALLLAGGAQAEPPGDEFLTEGRAHYSQGKEELIIRHFFGDERGGFFLDVGSYKWMELSTTLYLEEHLGWTGIAIDANSEFAKGFEENRPGTKFFSYIVTDHSGGELTFYVAEGSEGISSVDRSWIANFFRAFFPNAKPKVREVTVPTITLNDLLDREGVEKIDLLSMDIEGHEPEALAGFDIRRFRPRLVCIESNPKLRAKLLNYFIENGYERIEAYDAHDVGNWYFRPASD